MAVRILLAVTAALMTTSLAAAMPRVAPPATPSDVVAVQDRFLPRLFGRGEQQSGNSDVRLDQLEAEVRRLTGEVEQLRFTVQRLEQALGQGGRLPPPQNVAQPQPQLQSAPAQSAPVAPAPAASAPVPSGPIDLSALNTRLDGAGTAGLGAPAASAAPPPVGANTLNQQATIASSPGLSEARSLMDSGRYAMAVDKARTVLSSSPSSAEASEARFLAGEALMAQGDLRGAANYFLENYTSDPNGARAPESLVRLSRAFNQLGEAEAACSSIEELFGAYPNVAPGLRAQAEQERQAARCS